MTDRIKRYTVRLFGESYVIISDEPEVDVLQAVDRFNDYMQVLVAESGIQDAKKIALLTGLQLSQELLALQRRYDAMENYNKRVASLVDMIDSVVDFSDTKNAAQVV
jgi:cell division protein ZapA (FtsZ GTPase activity inhibitor)